MNGNCHISNGNEGRGSDLLTHKYRPNNIHDFYCHPIEALRLKQWIEEFVETSGNIYTPIYNLNEDSSVSNTSDVTYELRKCVLLTGPPGVGKTSMVYAVANQLGLHVVESHPSDRRDSKLFGMLKLTNQKGKINPIAKLFQAAQEQQQQKRSSRKKRIRLSNQTIIQTNGTHANPSTQNLSLSGDTSIILFDDVDVIFEEDGPFLKSLVDFVKESKRPVILTATQSIDHILTTIVRCEHIHLKKPSVHDCAKLLLAICKDERYNQLAKGERCQNIAERVDCDIRQCLNRIHFYENRADKLELDFRHATDVLAPDFSKFNTSDIEHEQNNLILGCYGAGSLADIMDNGVNRADRSTLRQRWLDGKPSLRNEELTFDYDLGEQIRDSIVDLSLKIYAKQLKPSKELSLERNNLARLHQEYLKISDLINLKINSRIEPPEKEFYQDIVPMFGEIIKIEARNRMNHRIQGGASRRSRRLVSYLDLIGIYIEPDDIDHIAEAMIGIEDKCEDDGETTDEA